MGCILNKDIGGHNYNMENSSTNDCLFGCGAWMGGDRSDAPNGIDPFGECPKNPIFATAGILVGADLDKFKVQEYTEVYKTDFDGRKTKSLGYFKDNSVAEAFSGKQTYSAWHKTAKVLLLTDGKVAYLVV
jgi:hypothetical protein